MQQHVCLSLTFRRTQLCKQTRNLCTNEARWRTLERQQLRQRVQVGHAPLKSVFLSRCCCCCCCQRQIFFYMSPTALSANERTEVKPRYRQLPRTTTQRASALKDGSTTGQTASEFTGSLGKRSESVEQSLRKQESILSGDIVLMQKHFVKKISRLFTSVDVLAIKYASLLNH